ncbi:hypothetical protein CEXT_207301 [Caerostris extrusa]|uniref:Uncharacterized protein n=1 Tax=Caerostris extrusa TaxID=172846 RepID=A0AAV4XJI5_CAEEX|nr:hypothetical protein CEXT_207301 [Caerostris extrusa]
MAFKHKLPDYEKIKFTCGWSSQHLAWDKEWKRGQMSHDNEACLREWLAGKTQKRIKSGVSKLSSLRAILFTPYATQSLPEDSLQRYVKSLSTTEAVLTPNIDGVLHHGDVIQLKTREGLSLAALPNDLGKDGNYLAPCRVTATTNDKPLLRTAFHVHRFLFHFWFPSFQVKMGDSNNFKEKFEYPRSHL